MSRAALLGLVLLLVFGLTASAQTRSVANDSINRPRLVGVGGGLTSLFFPGEGTEHTGTFETRVNVFRAIAGGLAIHSHGLEGFYDLHVRVTGKAVRGVAGFFKIGGVGSYETRYQRERRTTLPTGEVVIYPAHREGKIQRPIAASVGGGAVFGATDRISVDVGGEAWLNPRGLVFTLRMALVVGVGPRR
jgi:hypothetical protein